jgi:hypothetical protein
LRNWLEREIMRDDELLHRFLLGELEEDEVERVEKRLLEEDELFDLCEAIEADLLEAAVRGGLTPAERERVLERLASSPQGRARLALARNLVDIAAPRKNLLSFPRLASLTARPAVRWAAAACLVALLGTWFVVDESEQEPQIAQQEEPPLVVDPGKTGTFHQKLPDQPIGKPDVEETPPVTEPAPPPAAQDRVAKKEPEPLGQDEDETVDPSTFVVQLATLLRTGEDPLQKIEIPHGKAHVALHVQISDLTLEPFDSYDAVVTREEGHEVIWKKDHLEPASIDGIPALALTLPANDLPPGRYEVEIFGNPAEANPDPLMERRFEVTGGE